MVYHEVMKHDSTAHHLFVSINQILVFTIFIVLLNYHSIITFFNKLNSCIHHFHAASEFTIQLQGELIL